MSSKESSTGSTSRRDSVRGYRDLKLAMHDEFGMGGKESGAAGTSTSRRSSLCLRFA